MTDGLIHPDQRPEPANKLSAAVLDVCSSKEFSSLQPRRIVPKLADQGLYQESESVFYRKPAVRAVCSD